MIVKVKNKEVKIPDKEIKNLIWILLLFIIGFIVGCFAMNMEKQNTIMGLEKTIEEKQKKIDEQYVEIDSLRETVYMYNLYGK